jgi:UvrD-like helicase C-terminal domain/AAA domain/Nuclease-related domain
LIKALRQLNSKLFPSSPKHYPGGLYRELDVLQRLESGLPVGYAVFHNVEWQSLIDGNERHGEIDIVVLSPMGNMMLIEVKAGDVLLRNGGLFKLYGSSQKDVLRQSRTQYSAMMGRLTDSGIWSKVLNCIVLPDYDIPDGQQVIAAHRERIITASQYQDLPQWVHQQLSVLQPVPDPEAVTHFLSNLFQVQPRIDAMRDQLSGITERLSDGLATWVPRLSYQGTDGRNITIQVEATAGSGKTQLAVRLLTDAAQRRQSALYLCYNRPLADAIRQNVPTRCQVATFHEYALDAYRSAGYKPDFQGDGVFGQIEQTYLQQTAQGQYDLIIVDEAQDFEGCWIARIHEELKEAGAFYILGDASQRLYDREPFELVDVIHVESPDNFRSPRSICDTINALGLAPKPINARSAYVGDIPEFVTYGTDAALMKVTEQAVEAVLQGGFALSDIALLSYRGFNHSKLLAYERLGKWPLRRFIGQYDDRGEQVWTPGELLVDTVYRFKGQSASAIILTEVDFKELTDAERRKLFVAMTRARLRLTVILSETAHQCLQQYLTQES